MTEPKSAIAAVVAAHERRLAALDPLLPPAQPLPDSAPEDVALSVPGAMALLRLSRPDPESFLATWGAAEQHRLIPRVGGPDPVAAMAALLAESATRVRSQVSRADPETEFALSWPSRDVAMTERFLACGLVPAVVVAARPAARPTPDGGARAQVRQLRLADVEPATGLWLEEVRWDAQFGGVTERASTVPNLRRLLTEEVAQDRPWAWVAECDGQLCGLLVLTPPERAGWVAPLVSRAPAAYLTCLVVTGGRRGSGVGAALVRRAHAALDEAGVAVTLLHYAALNPLSVPFWHRCGYRPLWTGWQARPASRLRVTE